MTIANWTPYEIAGELIEELRKRRRSGSSASQLVPFLEENNVEDAIAADCFQLAFCLQSRIHFSRLRKGPYGTGRFDYEKIDRRFEPMIQEARDRWESAPPYPDLMGRSHREAFRWLALKRACYVIIRAPNPYSKAYVGKPGFRAAPAFLVAVARLTPPNAGLMAADPGSDLFRRYLAVMKPGHSHQHYLTALAETGIHVAGAEEGFVVTDGSGTRYYPPYFIQGVYAEDTGKNLWRAPEGDSIRRELNTMLGEQLIRFGAHDVWEHRDDDAMGGPEVGPQSPVIYFDPKGNSGVVFDAQRLFEEYRSWGISWPYSKQPQAS